MEFCGVVQTKSKWSRVRLNLVQHAPFTRMNSNSHSKTPLPLSFAPSPPKFLSLQNYMSEFSLMGRQEDTLHTSQSSEKALRAFNSLPSRRSRRRPRAVVQPTLTVEKILFPSDNLSSLTRFTMSQKRLTSRPDNLLGEKTDSSIAAVVHSSAPPTLILTFSIAWNLWLH